LHIRVEDLGRKGECKYCGYRFRPGETHLAERRVATLNKPPAQSRLSGRERAGAPSRLSPGGRQGTRLIASAWASSGEPRGEEPAPETLDDDQIVVRFENAGPPAGQTVTPATEATAGAREGEFELAGTGTELFQFEGEMPILATASAISSGGIAEQVGRLVQERDAAQAESAWLRHELEVLRLELGRRLSEVSRLRRTVDKLKAVRAECDRLNAERAMLVREASGLQARLVETQVELVEVEEELEEARARARVERHEWESRSLASERRLAELRGRIEAAGCMPAPGAGRPAEIDSLSATLPDIAVAVEEDVETAQCTVSS
jgi:hypothetical protein